MPVDARALVRFWTIVLALSNALATSAPAAGMQLHKGTATVEELIVAPNENGLSYWIHPKGNHLAAIVQKGSRWAVMYDGVDGPPFDEIRATAAGGRIAMSPDGTRFGDVGRANGNWVFMIDGKEGARVPVVGQTGAGLTINLAFSPNSKHWYAHYYNLGAPDPRTDPPRVYWDGVAGPLGGQSDIVVSPDGNRYAYTVQSPTSGANALAIDGKIVPNVGGVPQFTADGAHLFTQRTAPPIQGRPVTELLLDGRPIARAEKIDVKIPPAGDRVVYIIGRGSPQGGAEIFSLVVGNQRIPGSEATRYTRFTFSPDGKRFAASAGEGTRQRVSIDGKKGQEYESIDTIRFTPDSKHVVYTARAGTKEFVVTDETESEIGFAVVPPIPLQFTQSGHIGWLAPTDQGNAVVVDNRVTRTAGGVHSSDFTFSPDGAHYAWFTAGDQSGQLGGTVFVDGNKGTPGMLASFAQYRGGDPERYIWSPDSKYTVHYAAPGTSYGNDFGFVIGGKYLSLGNVRRVTIPTFTPDGKHLLWLVERGEQGMITVILDGRAVYEFDDRGREPIKAPGGWVMGADGTLAFFIQTTDGMKRVRITPGAENGFESWCATGRDLR